MMNAEHSTRRARDTGLAMVLLLLILAYVLRRINLLPPAIGTLLVAMLWPNAFRPLSKIWFGLAEVMGTVVSKILLTVLFYVLVVPIGKLRQMTGADPMNLKNWKTGSDSVFHHRRTTFQPSDLEKPY